MQARGPSSLWCGLCALGLFACASANNEGPSGTSGGSSSGGAATGAGGTVSGGASGAPTSAGGLPSSGGAPSAGGSANPAAGATAAGGAVSLGGTAGAAAASGGAATTSGGMATAAGGASPGAGGTASASGGAAQGTGGAVSGAGGAGAACSSAHAVYVVGDSTASLYAASLLPRMGWGQPLQQLFTTSCATVKDVALSGRSSKSFYDEGAWTPVVAALAPGDSVLIQFAHNDEKSDDPLRYTIPATTFKDYLTKYVQEARAKQAVPVLLTPIQRNKWSGTTVSESHGDYPKAMRELAAALQVPLIDMTVLTKAYMERIGQIETNKLFLMLAAGESPNYPTGVTDTTHLQERGAKIVGQIAMADAKRQNLAVAAWLTAGVAAP